MRARDLAGNESSCTFDVVVIHALRAFIRGDSNLDAMLDIADAVWTVSWLFTGGPAPRCLDSADANDDGVVDLADAIYTLSYGFRGGPPPPEPFSRSVASTRRRTGSVASATTPASDRVGRRAASAGSVLRNGPVRRGVGARSRTSYDVQGSQPTITSVTFGLRALFLGGERPPCEEACDVDANGRFNVTDAVYL